MLSTIKVKSTGAQVAALRGLLGMGDGQIYDDGVAAKVKEFQAAKKLAVDGIVGEATWTQLAKSAKTLKSGAANSQVRALQYLLGRLDTDGKYGKKTRAAVIAYQSAAKLSADGICGIKTWSALIIGGSVPETGENAKPKDFKQGAAPWGPKMYSSTGNSSQTYANSGCGPTSAADIVYTMRDKTISPEDLGKMAVDGGFRTVNNGTAWGFFKFIAQRYKFSKFAQTLSRATLQAALKDGALAICSMAPGYWTKGGHFICVWKDDGTTIYANDPASSTRKAQLGTQFMKECKQIFIFWA